jgi:hypothetical protein
VSNSTAFWLRINGYPATEIAAHTPPTWETLADGGIGEISWQFALTPRSQHQALKRGAVVEVMCGPMRVAVGLMTQPDRTTWQCHAYGLSSSLGRYLALDGEAMTRDVAVAVSTAQSHGCLVLNNSGVGGVTIGDTATTPQTVAALLTERAVDLGQRWGVDGRGELYMRPDPTSASWLASPDSAAFGVTDEDVPTLLVLRYDAGGGLYDTAFVGAYGDERDVDITDRGPLTPTEVETIGEGMLTRRGSVSWTNGVTLHREQLTTRGGTPAFLAAVTAGQMLRAHGLASNVIAQAPWLDVVIGKTRYTAGDDMIYLEPVNSSPIAGGLAGVIAA